MPATTASHSSASPPSTSAASVSRTPASLQAKGVAGSGPKRGEARASRAASAAARSANTSGQRPLVQVRDEGQRVGDGGGLGIEAGVGVRAAVPGEQQRDALRALAEAEQPGACGARRASRRPVSSAPITASEASASSCAVGSTSTSTKIAPSRTSTVYVRMSSPAVTHAPLRRSKRQPCAGQVSSWPRTSPASRR